MIKRFISSHITFQYKKKKTMILHVHWEVETKSDSDEDKKPSLEDTSDDEVKNPVEGESLMVRRLLSV
jgi:sortase (surface protein transpeptidase)